MSTPPLMPVQAPLRDVGRPLAPQAPRSLPLVQTRRGAANEEWLPFTIDVVRDEEALRAAVRVRQEAYSRHLPAFSATLSEPEPADTAEGVAVLLARSKLDGSPLGSMRIQTNAFAPLPVEASVELPAAFQGMRLAEATRLGVAQADVGSLVKTALFKSFVLYCNAKAIDYIVVAARSPVDRQYTRMMFTELFPGRGPIPLRHAGNLPHRILHVHLQSAAQMWRDAGHPLWGFMVETAHPDIRVGQQDLLRRNVLKPAVSLDRH